MPDTPPDTPVSLLLAHSEGLVREALAGMLESHGFQVPHQADSLEALVRSVRDNGGRSADLLLVEADLLGPDAQHLEQVAGFGRVVLLVRPGGMDEQTPVLRPGISGSLSLNLDGDHFAQSLRLLVQGDIVVSGDIAAAIAEMESTGGGSVDPLTEREHEVIGLVAAGATNREIAETLIITEHTVKVHLSHILEKLNLRNRQQAAAWAVRNGIIVDEEPAEGASGDPTVP